MRGNRLKEVAPVTLTDRKLSNIKPSAIRFKVFDGNGLYAEVLPSGTKSWRLKHYFAGKAGVKSLGHWPEVSVHRARELAFASRSSPERGANPFEPERGQILFESLAKDWGRAFLPKCT